VTDSYFGAPEQPPVKPGRFVSAEELAGFELAPGLMLRPLSGTNMMVSFARYAPHAEAPLHAHEEEQIFVVLDGEFEVQLGDEVRAMGVGDAALIPSWVPSFCRTFVPFRY
jgi:quercetin dioxygenase-like cupin family protein